MAEAVRYTNPRLTTVDGLTQISNKRHFLETLDRE